LSCAIQRRIVASGRETYLNFHPVLSWYGLEDGGRPTGRRAEYARQPRDIRLQTRDARRKLAERHEPYWHELRRGSHLGYRKGGSGGVWWLREFRSGRYAKRRLGIADDDLDGDATAVLSWSDALTVALGEQRPTAHAPAPYTVCDALDDYFAHRAAKSPSTSLEIDRSKARAAITPKLGESKVATVAERPVRLHPLAADEAEAAHI